MDTLLSAELRSFGSTAMFQRNWPCAELLVVYFGSASSVGAWDEALYACMVAQAMHMQGLIAAVRAQVTILAHSPLRLNSCQRTIGARSFGR